MARRRNTILDAINSFNAAYDTTTKVGKDIELSRIAQAKPEEVQGFTTEDSNQLRAAADSGQYDIGIKTKEDGTFDSYTVTPKADPTQTGSIAMRGVTDFMGKRTAGSMSDDQVDRARQTAMAGVLEKYDPQEGMRMRREIKSQERDDERWGQQQKQWGREEEERNREVQYRTEREQLLQSSPMGQAQAATAQYEQQLAAYNDAIKAGKTPQEIGLPPQKPNIQRPGPMQTLAGYADLIAHDYKYGKLNTDGLIQFQDRMQKLEQENYTKALTVAQSGGTPEQIAKAFNTAGMQIDPKNVTVTRTKQANGPDQVVLNYKDDKGQTATINVLSELEGYGKAKEVFDRFYQGETNRRGNEQLQLSKNADGRAGAQFAQGQADRAQTRADAQAKADASLALFKEQNPNATPAQLEAARKGILAPATGKGDKYTVEMGDVTTALGTPAVDRNGNPRMDPITGKQQINRDPKKEAEFFQWMRDNNITDTNKGLAVYLGQKREAPAKAPYADGTELRGKDGKTYVVRNGVPVPK